MVDVVNVYRIPAFQKLGVVVGLTAVNTMEATELYVTYLLL